MQEITRIKRKLDGMHRSARQLCRAVSHVVFLVHQREQREGVKEYRRKIKNKSTMMDTEGGDKNV